MHKISILAALTAIALSGSACSNIFGDDSKNNEYKPLQLTTKSAEFVEKGNTFTFNFIDRINASTKQDYVISPLSMQFLLGMILDGAQGDTADEICSVLGYGQGEVAAVNEYCLSMLQQLPSLDRKTRLTIANAIFVDDGWPLKDSYKTTVSQYYQAQVANLDFADATGSLKAMNGWCASHTNNLIPKVLDEVSTDMLAYLFNAMYFKSEWTDRFSKSATADEPFTVESGQKRPVKMMKQEREFEYGENSHFRWVVLPYGNSVKPLTVWRCSAFT